MLMREGVDGHTDENTVGCTVNIICQEQEIMYETRARAVLKDLFEKPKFCNRHRLFWQIIRTKQLLSSNALQDEHEEKKGCKEE